jgi:hypothetical protein
MVEQSVIKELECLWRWRRGLIWDTTPKGVYKDW